MVSVGHDAHARTGVLNIILGVVLSAIFIIVIAFCVVHLRRRKRRRKHETVTVHFLSHSAVDNDLKLNGQSSPPALSANGRHSLFTEQTEKVSIVWTTFASIWLQHQQNSNTCTVWSTVRPLERTWKSCHNRRNVGYLRVAIRYFCRPTFYTHAAEQATYCSREYRSRLFLCRKLLSFLRKFTKRLLPPGLLFLARICTKLFVGWSLSTGDELTVIYADR